MILENFVCMSLPVHEFMDACRWLEVCKYIHWYNYVVKYSEVGQCSGMLGYNNVCH